MREIESRCTLQIIVSDPLEVVDIHFKTSVTNYRSHYRSESVSSSRASVLSTNVATIRQSYLLQFKNYAYCRIHFPPDLNTCLALGDGQLSTPTFQFRRIPLAGCHLLQARRQILR
jgi:hypothetical protein